MSFVISWLFWIPYNILACENDSPALMILLLLGFTGPFVGALFIVVKNEGVKGVASHLKSGFKVRGVGVKYLLVFFIFPLAYIIYLLAATILLGDSVSITIVSDLFSIVFFLVIFLIEAYLEEYSWRGHFLKELQVKNSALKSSAIVGFFWTLWHLPLKYCLEEVLSPLFVFRVLLLFLLFFSYSVVFTWLYNNVNESVFAMSLFHGALNTLISIVFISYGVPSELLMTYRAAIFAFTIAALAVIIVLITRKRLSKKDK